MNVLLVKNVGLLVFLGLLCDTQKTNNRNEMSPKTNTFRFFVFLAFSFLFFIFVFACLFVILFHFYVYFSLFAFVAVFYCNKFDNRFVCKNPSFSICFHFVSFSLTVF